MLYMSIDLRYNVRISINHKRHFKRHFKLWRVIQGEHFWGNYGWSQRKYFVLHISQHFYPRPVLSFMYCRCLRLCFSMCQSLACPRDNSRPVQARITKFETQVYKILVKIPFVLRDDWPLPSRSNLHSNSKYTPFWACPCDNSSPVEARTTKFGPEVQNTLIKIPIVLGIDWAWHVKLNLFSKSCLYASFLRLWNICETCKNGWKRSLFHILNGCAQICSPTRSCHGPWNGRVVSLVRPLLASQSSTRPSAMDFWMPL